MEGTSWNVLHGSYLIEATPWELRHGTLTFAAPRGP